MKGRDAHSTVFKIIAESQNVGINHCSGDNVACDIVRNITLSCITISRKEMRYNTLETRISNIYMQHQDSPKLVLYQSNCLQSINDKYDFDPPAM